MTKQEQLHYPKGTSLVLSTLIEELGHMVAREHGFRIERAGEYDSESHLGFVMVGPRMDRGLPMVPLVLRSAAEPKLIATTVRIARAELSKFIAQHEHPANEG